jgi:K+-sensing histidine kinase KdpD
MLVVLMTVATAIGLGLKRLGVDDPELALVPAVILLWLIDGLGGGISAVIVATGIAWYIFLPPQWSFRIADASELWELIIYVAVTGFICYVIEGQKKRITELLADNLALNRRLLERQAARIPSADD